VALKDFSQQRTVAIDRMGTKHSLKVSGDAILSTLSAKKDFGLTPAGIKTTVASVITLGPAGSAGLQVGDTITAIAGNLIASAQHLVQVVKEHKDSAFVVEWVRNGKPFSATVKPDAKGLIGIYPTNILGDKLHIQYSFVESVGQGFQKTGNSLMMFVSTVQQIFSGTIQAKQALGGPIKIAEMSKQSADLGIIPFLTLVAMLSITLAVMNILPIPALDGGHLLFIIIEAIIRREVPLKVKVIFQQVGMVILLALMAFVLYNDIF
jgi:regulator of sigma E protease